MGQKNEFVSGNDDPGVCISPFLTELGRPLADLRQASPRELVGLEKRGREGGREGKVDELSVAEVRFFSGPTSVPPSLPPSIHPFLPGQRDTRG